jgi:hypothetical protein
MNIQATTIVLFSKKAVDYDSITSKLLKLNTLDKTVDVLSGLLSQTIVSVVVAIFRLPTKIESLKCLSGFCYDTNSKAR